MKISCEKFLKKLLDTYDFSLYINNYTMIKPGENKMSDYDMFDVVYTVDLDENDLNEIYSRQEWEDWVEEDEIERLANNYLFDY